MSDIDVEILPDPEALARRTAALVAGQLAAAVNARGLATLALSGGSSPAAFERELAQHDLPWEAIHIFQVDERVAPPGDKARNLTGLQSALLDHVKIPPGNVHPMPVDDPDLEAAAARYAEELRSITGPEGGLDVVHLGLGDDGHTASWPPGDPVVEATTDTAIVGPFNGHLRMTLTPPVVNRAGWIVWLIPGQEKAAMLQRLLDGDQSIPAAHVRRTNVALLTTR